LTGGAATRLPQLVIFDCDGVLVDSEPISCGVLARMLSEAGARTTLAEARRDYQGLLLGDVLLRAQQRLGRDLPADWLARFERERDAAFARELAPVAGAAEAVARVHAAGIAVCVASQGKLQKTRRSLALTGLARLFAEDARFSAHDVTNGKPAPDLFLHAAATMGAVPERCVVVEDTPSGVQAAVAAGMLALGYAADGDERTLRAAGARTFHAMRELPLLLAIARPK
jgi:HAD superfamily hydrolase (TIGR01509 family)